MKNAYVIITPARDEQEYLERTIISILNQTVLPLQWILVDDGSSDGTGQIMDRYAEQYSWITVCHREDRGFRKAGGGVVDAFYEGYALVDRTEWEFLVKLDADLNLSPNYFAQCFAEFDNDPRLGIGGGAIYHEVGGRLLLERNPIFHVRGATKIYRYECWNDLGGLMRAPGWDTVDELTANMLGWKTRSFLFIHVLHYRFTGSADGSWRNALKDGRANYTTGYHPLFMILKCASRSLRRPYLVGSVGLMLGFVNGYWRGAPQVQDQRLIRYVRKQQLRRLMFQESIWR